LTGKVLRETKKRLRGRRIEVTMREIAKVVELTTIVANVEVGRAIASRRIIAIVEVGTLLVRIAESNFLRGSVSVLAGYACCSR